MFDPVSLAATAVGSFLMPYVKEGAKKLGEAVAKDLGESAGKEVAGIASKLWQRVSAAFSSGQELTVLNLFSEDPETYQKPLEKMLGQKMEREPAFAKEVHQLLNAPLGNVGNTAASIMNAAVAGILDMRGARVMGGGGTFAGVVYNPAAYTQTSTPARSPDARKSDRENS